MINWAWANCRITPPLLNTSLLPPKWKTTQCSCLLKQQTFKTINRGHPSFLQDLELPTFATSKRIWLPTTKNAIIGVILEAIMNITMEHFFRPDLEQGQWELILLSNLSNHRSIPLSRVFRAPGRTNCRKYKRRPKCNWSKTNQKLRMKSHSTALEASMPKTIVTERFSRIRLWLLNNIWISAKSISKKSTKFQWLVNYQHA